VEALVLNKSLLRVSSFYIKSPDKDGALKKKGCFIQFNKAYYSVTGNLKICVSINVLVTRCGAVG
jgi:hypothetical protein